MLNAFTCLLVNVECVYLLAMLVNIECAYCLLISSVNGCFMHLNWLVKENGLSTHVPLVKSQESVLRASVE